MIACRCRDVVETIEMMDDADKNSANDHQLQIMKIIDEESSNGLDHDAKTDDRMLRDQSKVNEDHSMSDTLFVKVLS